MDMTVQRSRRRKRGMTCVDAGVDDANHHPFATRGRTRAATPQRIGADPARTRIGRGASNPIGLDTHHLWLLRQPARLSGRQVEHQRIEHHIQAVDRNKLAARMVFQRTQYLLLLIADGGAIALGSG